MDGFFNLGNKATKGSPVRKAQFDYNLYWVIFLAFLFLGIKYLYSFITNGGFNSLMWGLVMLVFTWFNYQGLIGMRNAYHGMKKAYGENHQVPEEDIKEMMEEFCDETKNN